MKGLRFLAITASALFLSVLLCACTFVKVEEPVQEVTPSPTEAALLPEPSPASFTIWLYTDAGESSITATDGETLTLPEAEAPQGFLFYAWFDQNDGIVDRTFTVTGDMCLYAHFLPSLTDNNHAPYLSMDSSWHTRPNDVVSHKELVKLFASLVNVPPEEEAEEVGEESAESRNSEEDDEDQDYVQAVTLLRRLGGIKDEDFAAENPVTQEELFTILAPFFPSQVEPYIFEHVDNEDDDYPAFCLAMEQGWLTSAEDAEPDRLLTRLQFASIINDVLHRSADPAFLAAAREVLFDLPEDDAEALIMLEATIVHNCLGGEVHENWTDAELPDRPFADFTTGDLEVDNWIKQIFEERLTEGMTLKEKMAALYRYVRDTPRYRKGEIHEEADTAWVLTEVRKMMEEGGGNCFTYASTLCELYRALGVDAKIYAGTISSQANPHAWVEANVNGTVYIYDVEMEATRMRFNHPYYDFFMRTYYDVKGWDYQRDYVVAWG